MTDWREPCRHCGVLLGRAAAVQSATGVSQWSYYSSLNGQKQCKPPGGWGYAPLTLGEARVHAPFMPDLKNFEEVMAWLS